MDSIFFFLSCLVPVFILFWLSYETQEKFSELYKDKIDPTITFLPGKISNKDRNDSSSYIKKAPKLLLRTFEILWRDYHNDEINKLAHTIRLFFIVEMLIIITNLVVFNFFYDSIVVKIFPISN